MEIEITQPLELTDEQESLLSMHSLLNVITIISTELQLIQLEAGDGEILKPSIDRCFAISTSLSNQQEAVQNIQSINNDEKLVFASIEKLFEKYPEQRKNKAILEDVENLRSIFRVLRVRATEVLARHQEPEQWVIYNIVDLKRDFNNFFYAVEKNSKGRYRIVSNIAQQEESDYVVNLTINSIEGNIIRMPMLFKDVMRDLLANARKYTAPGGMITSGLSDDGFCLRFAVSDTGAGIPEDQISKVVQFGMRGSNMVAQGTKGGGFGLTKAYYVTKQFNGRMWIKSELDKGTVIRLELPIKR